MYVDIFSVSERIGGCGRMKRTVQVQKPARILRLKLPVLHLCSSIQVIFSPTKRQTTRYIAELEGDVLGIFKKKCNAK